jgi:hypothetical protein
MKRRRHQYLDDVGVSLEECGHVGEPRRRREPLDRAGDLALVHVAQGDDLGIIACCSIGRAVELEDRAEAQDADPHGVVGYGEWGGS